LIYLPLEIQRRLAEGAQLPLVCLAAWGLTTGLRRVWRRPARRAAAIAVGAASLLTAPLLLIGGLGVALTPARPAFLPAEALGAFRWLAEAAEPGAAVLTYFEAGNALPAYAPVIVYLGHGPETAFAERKKGEVEAFFNVETDDDFRRSLLRRAQIAFVLDTPAELTERAVLSALPYLQLEYESGEYALYRVVMDGEG
jgi:hypothetical protein